MMRKCTLLAVVVTTLTTACGFTTEGSAIREFVKVEGAGAYDEGLLNSEWFICRAASVGAVMRRYAVSVEKAEAWRALCLPDPDAMSLMAPVVPVDLAPVSEP